MTESTTAGPRPAEPGPATQDIAVRPSQLSVPGDLVELRRRNLATRWPEKETVTDQSQPGAVADVILTAAAAVARPAAATGG
jgi:hypothetical protein